MEYRTACSVVAAGIPARACRNRGSPRTEPEMGIPAPTPDRRGFGRLGLTRGTRTGLGRNLHEIH